MSQLSCSLEILDVKSSETWEDGRTDRRMGEGDSTLPDRRHLNTMRPEAEEGGRRTTKYSKSFLFLFFLAATPRHRAYTINPRFTHEATRSERTSVKGLRSRRRRRSVSRSLPDDRQSPRLGPGNTQHCRGRVRSRINPFVVEIHHCE